MGLLNKLKDIFFEEELVEVEEQEQPEPKEKVTVAKKIETPEVRKKEEPVTEEVPQTVDIEEKEETIEIEKPKDFKFPMSFDDKDFEVEKTIELEEPVKLPEEQPREVAERVPNVEEPVVEERETREVRYEEVYEEPKREEKEEKTLYHGLYEGKENKEKPGFTPSPIISPIYGILNKNYKKDEIVSKKEVRLSQATTKKADLDLVREKAYGDLAGEISASIEDDLKKDDNIEKLDVEEEPKKEDLLYDLNEEEPTVKTVTVGDAEEYFNDLGLEYNVDYKVENKVVEKEEKNEPVVVEKETNKIDFDDPSDDKNLFDLIDSMYEDKE